MSEPTNRIGSTAPFGVLSDGTPVELYTLRNARGMEARISEEEPQHRFGKGYDHNWVINKQPGELAPMARVYEPTSGRVMEVLSTKPATQFYTGNFLDGTITGKGGWAYQIRNGFCFEPQHYPDAPNQPAFPSTVLKPGQTYQNTIIYKFSTR